MVDGLEPKFVHRPDICTNYWLLCTNTRPLDDCVDRVPNVGVTGRFEMEAAIA